MSNDVVTEEQIGRLIPVFYDRVRRGEQLGPVFENAIDDWQLHIDKLRSFWSSVMLGSGRYKGQPMVAHLRHEHAMSPENFDRWLTLWRKTTNDLLDEDGAHALQEKAERIAESLMLGVQFQRGRNPL